MELRAFLVAAVVVSGIAAFSDWRKGVIPPWLTGGAIVIAPIAHGLLGGLRGDLVSAFEAFALSLAGAAVCGAVPLLLYSLGGGKGGDVKLLAALGAICRPMIGIELELYGFVAAAVLAMGQLAFHGSLLRTLGNAAMLLVNPFLPRARRKTIAPEAMTWMRLGPAVLVGTCVATLIHWSAT